MQIAVGIEKPALSKRAAVKDEIQAIEPTDKSIPAVNITKAAPTEIIPVIETCLKIVVTVPKEKKLDDAKEKIKINIKRIKTIP